MVCSKCGYELNDGEIYCPNCGQAVQIVPDFNVIEDELLPELLSDHPKAGQTEKEILSFFGLSEDDTPQSKKRAWVRVAVIACVVILFVTGIATTSYCKSEPYILEKAQKYEEAKEYDKALVQYRQLLGGSDPKTAYFGIIEIQQKQGKDKEVEKTLLEAIKKYPDEIRFFKPLLEIYDNDGNMDAINRLDKQNKNTEIAALIEGYRVHAPEFSVEGGDYDSDLKLELTSPDGSAIYYTTDGSKPTKKKGEPYEKPIEIHDGKTTITACCIDEDGNVSELVKEEYNISYLTPKMPDCSPKSGTYHEQTYITITSTEKNVTLYYAWNGIIPTKDAALYTEPLLMPEGNHVLSVVAINKAGVSSPIRRCNYVYQP